MNDLYFWSIVAFVSLVGNTILAITLYHAKEELFVWRDIYESRKRAN